MSNMRPFHEWFVDASDADVCTALANAFPKPGTLSEHELSSLVMNLWAMDEGHLAAAVVILSHHAPHLLLPHLPRLLADSRTGI